jgi:hypothetical protein
MTLLTNLTLFIFALLQYDGKLRADYLTEPAAQALALICHSGDGIALGAQLVAHLESLLGAELDTVAASLTSFSVDYDCCGFGGFFFLVEGRSP